jgi:chemosensory pili system protein ChpA (sensor histidine kinase/response regulator)
MSNDKPSLSERYWLQQSQALYCAMNNQTPTLSEQLSHIEKLAQQLNDDGYHGLYDISLLLIDALHTLTEQPKKSESTLPELLSHWQEQVNAYKQHSATAINDILQILRHPDLNLPFEEDDFATFAMLLAEDLASPAHAEPAVVNTIKTIEPQETTATIINNDKVDFTPLVADLDTPSVTFVVADKLPSLKEQLPHIEAQAQQINAEGYAGLYDVCLLLIDALNAVVEQPETGAKSDLPALLNNWATLVEAYKQNSATAIDDMLLVLRHPDLNLPFEEDDFATFALLLAEDLANKQAATSVAIQSDSVVTAVEDDEPAPTLSTAAKELIELLDTEAGLLNYRLQAVALDEPIAARTEHLQQAGEELERMANAAKMVGFDALGLVCEQVNANIALFVQDIDNFNETKRNLLLDWVALVKSYLTIFYKKTAGAALLKQLTLPDWAYPLSDEASTLLLTAMQVKNFGAESDEESKREKIATDEDVSLALPDDVNKELLDLLLQELPGYTQQFSGAIQNLQAGGSSKDIDVAQRIAHTIKGSANTVGIKGIAILTHQIEDILMACAKAHKKPNRALLDTLINASDCLEAMCESLLGMGEAPQDARVVLQEVLDWANQIDKKGIQDDAEAPARTEQNEPIHSKSSATDPVKPSTATEKKEPEASTPTAMVRVPTDQIENLFRLSSESIILNGQIYERQRRLKAQLQAIEEQFALLQQLGAELEQVIDLKDLSGRSTVNTGKNFDALEMDQYNELHTASRRMVEAAVDAREISVDMKKELETMNEVLEYQQRLVINTQEAVMQTRFVPVGSIVLRLQRGLRQTCRLTGKEGELTFIGENLLIDGDTLNALVEPLMHLLRNAIDHGLEDEQERNALGKPRVGQIRIEFDREGNSILVRCSDDGRGLDFDSIRRTAEQRGDIKVGETVSEEDLKRLILRPNFSTRNQLTQTSGRGVGMDVVNFQVLSLGGSLSLFSKYRVGLTVELRVPLPLSRSHALLAYAGPYKVAISSKGLTQILYSGVGELKTINHKEVLIVGEEIYPVVKLEDLLHIGFDRRKTQRPHGAVLLVQHNDTITAVLVGVITDSREVVIKNIGYYMRKIHGFVGATILGDGSVTPVLDIPELLRAPQQAQTATHHSARSQHANTPHPKLPLVLIVDDSLSQRRALEHILTDAGFRIYSARDGIEAAEWLAKVKPDIVITDLEMPRMNGIELTSHIRTQANMKDLPIIMVTSRSTQKHKQLAEEAGIDFYLTKPVQDDELLTKIQSLLNQQRVEEVA